MHPISTKDTRLPIQVLVLAIFTVLALFIWEGSKGFNLWDEGFLWYGTQRVMLGEVPIRDFMAYDPGRYYWSAALMSLWDANGIMALRGAVAIFQAIGLFAGLLLISRTEKKHSFLYLVLSAVTLALWMLPRHKLFDISLSILLIGVLTFLVQRPTNRRYFMAGACIGLIAIFGRNHGMYAIAGSLGVMIWLNIKRVEGPGLFKGFSLWAGGVVIGFTPLILIALLVPGFFSAFLNSILFLFEIKATNLSLPIPWPWLVNFGSAPLSVVIRDCLIGVFFIATVVFGVLSIMWVFWKKFQDTQVSPVLVAVSFLAIPYAHYAYSRADISHLAQGIFPLLIGCLALLSTQPPKIKWFLALILCTASFWVSYVFHPGWQCHINNQCVTIEISGSSLQVDASTESDIQLLRSLSNQYTPNGQNFIVAPFWPGAYALLERKSPMWEIYALFPRPETFEQAEIERIKAARPGFALIFDLPLDGHDELRFLNTHPLINKYIRDNFEPLPNPPNPAYQMFKAKK